MPTAVEVSRVTHAYGQRRALDKLNLEVAPGEIFAILGPNGSGKTTLFRLIATLIPVQRGTIRVCGFDVAANARQVRAQLGVVFQSPSVDKKLTVSENVRQQGHLYGLHGAELAERERTMLARLRLADRADDRVETLSGGLRRRVELAKGMLHTPRVLLLDEPSTGLDPAARIDMWNYLESISRNEGVTVILTTHLLDEADRANRIAILDQGRLVACDAPDRLRQTVGGDAIVIEAEAPNRLAAEVRERFALEAGLVDGRVRLEVPQGHHWIARLVEAFPGQIRSITLSQPTLEDVFINRTGHCFLTAKRELIDGHPA